MIIKKLARVISFRYLILAVILIILAGGLLLLPKSPRNEGIPAEQLLGDAINPSRYISTDEVANKIIERDPSFILVDVRNPQEFSSYSLPNALNIPLQDLLNEEHEIYLNQSQYDIVFYSNDNFHADQAWLLSKRLGYKNLRVLDGGMNQWYTTIINPKIPEEKMSEQDFELYSSRKAASMYFGVMYPEQRVVEEVETPKPAPKKVIPVKKKKKRPVEGGC